MSEMRLLSHLFCISKVNKEPVLNDADFNIDQNNSSDFLFVMYQLLLSVMKAQVCPAGADLVT